MAAKKEIAELRSLAETQGWHLEGDGGHIKWYPPDGGQFIVTSATPSDSNIIKTIKKDLENAGLILDKQQWKRMEKAIRNGEREIVVEARPLAVQSLMDRTDDEIAAAIEKNQPDVWEAIRNSSVRKQVAFQMYREWGSRGPDGDWPTVCATCDQEFTSPLGLAMHVYRREPDHVPRWTIKVAGDHHCFACDSSFDEMWEWAAHLAESHDFHMCPHCDEMMHYDTLVAHVDDCPDRPAEVATVAAESPRDPLLTRQPDNPTESQEDEILATAKSETPRRLESVEMTDDELFGLLEMVLDGPVMVTRESLTAINDWMDATRRLVKIRKEQAA